MQTDRIRYNREVQEALRENRPVVALESTIISHGMPWPDNLKTAMDVEDILRKQHVTPATIALYGGRIHVGIDKELATQLARPGKVMKASRRDLAYALATEQMAATTVSATMYCAHLAGISLFVTGGIGGVHMDAEHSFDISADLTELCETPVTVICAGAKSILDLPKTLEVLETHGVPVIGYKTDEFPAFYSHNSGIPLVARLDTPEAIAELMLCQADLGLRNGIVIANPIPQQAEIPKESLDPFILQAREESKSLQGKAVTPFLLARINELTAGLSLKANTELIKNNAFLGAQVANAHHLISNSKKLR